MNERIFKYLETAANLIVVVSAIIALFLKARGHFRKGGTRS